MSRLLALLPRLRVLFFSSFYWGVRFGLFTKVERAGAWVGRRGTYGRRGGHTRGEVTNARFHSGDSTCDHAGHHSRVDKDRGRSVNGVKDFKYKVYCRMLRVVAYSAYRCAWGGSSCCRDYCPFSSRRRTSVKDWRYGERSSC